VKRQNLTRCRFKTPQLVDKKLEKSDYIYKMTHVSNFVKISPLGALWQMKKIYNFFITTYFFVNVYIHHILANDLQPNAKTANVN